MLRKSIILPAVVLAVSACSQVDQAGKKTPETKPVEPVAQAAELVQKSCQDAEYRQLDFWVGEWDLEWDAGDGNTGHGTNIITNTPYGDCVITENFNGAPTMQFKGMSVSTFHKPAGMWRQAWVDDQGGYFSLYGGPQDDGTFKLDMTRLNEKAPYRRMVWKDITTDSLTWHWQGHNADETEWSDQWVIRYKRKK